MKKSQRTAARNAAQNAAAMRDWAERERMQTEQGAAIRVSVLVGVSPAPTEKVRKLREKERRAAEERARQQARLRFSVKDAQAGVCRFVRLKNLRTVNPDKHTAYKRAERLRGLQIENKLYYIKSGELRFVWINKPGNKVEEEYSGLPQWAGEELSALYKAHVPYAAEVRRQ